MPDAVIHALMPLIPKEEGGVPPLGQRPLTLLSFLYRLWAAARLSQLKPWLKAWQDPAVFSAGAGAGAMDAWYHTAVEIEAALIEGRDFSLGIADVVKAVDTVKLPVLRAFMRAFGL